MSNLPIWFDILLQDFVHWGYSGWNSCYSPPDLVSRYKSWMDLLLPSLSFITANVSQFPSKTQVHGIYKCADCVFLMNSCWFWLFPMPISFMRANYACFSCMMFGGLHSIYFWTNPNVELRVSYSQLRKHSTLARSHNFQPFFLPNFPPCLFLNPPKIMSAKLCFPLEIVLKLKN